MNCPKDELEQAMADGMSNPELLDLLCEHLRRFGRPVDRTNWERLDLQSKIGRVRSALDEFASDRAN